MDRREAEAVAIAGSCPDSPVTGEQRGRLLAECLAELPGDQRELLLLHYADGVELRLIALRRGVTAKTVSQWHGSALAAMRARLADRGVTRFDNL